MDCRLCKKKLNNIDLPPEKHCFGHQSSSSNLASRCEIGSTPIVLFVIKSTFIYYKRLSIFPIYRLLSKAFQTDQDLHLSRYKSCLAKNKRSAGIKDNIKSIDSEIDKKLTELYKQHTKDKLENLKVQDGS